MHHHITNCMPITCTVLFLLGHKDWTANDVVKWLEGNDLMDVAELFRGKCECQHLTISDITYTVVNQQVPLFIHFSEAGISGCGIELIDRDLLKDIGVKAIGKQLHILHCIKELLKRK